MFEEFCDGNDYNYIDLCMVVLYANSSLSACSWVLNLLLPINRIPYSGEFCRRKDFTSYMNTDGGM